MNSQRLLDVGVTQLWQSTVVIVLAIVFTATLARRRPHLAYAIWLLVLIKCLTPPLWSSRAGVFSWIGAERATTHRATASAVVTPPPSMLEPAPLAPTSTIDSTPIVAGTTARAIDLPAIALSLWAVGAASVLMIGVARWMRLHRSIARRRIATPPAATTLFDALRDSLHARLPVSLVVTTHPIGPALLGVWRPIVVVHESVAGDHRNLRTILCGTS